MTFGSLTKQILSRIGLLVVLAGVVSYSGLLARPHSHE